jgi:hypothetical protein
MLEIAVRFSPSPLAFQASLQTSIFQARNPSHWSRMNPLKRSDVKNHLRPPFLAGIHLVQPDAAGFFALAPDIIETNPLSFADDFIAEHSSSQVAVAPVDPATGLGSRQVHTASKSAQQ